MIKDEIVTIFGGSGFIGRYIVRLFAQAGYRIRVAVRNVEKAEFLKTAGRPGQIAVVQANIRSADSVAAAVSGASIVVNAVGILFESGSQKFESLLKEGVKNIVTAIKNNEDSPVFVHLSALGADQNTGSVYATSKLEGEREITLNYHNWIILRPSIVYGEEDQFFNKFAKMSFLSPFLPAIGGGKTKFQPVDVKNLAQAVFNAATNTEKFGNKIYEIGGNEVFTFRQLLEKTCFHIGRKRMILSIPFSLAKIKAFFFEFLPVPLLTRDQVELLKTDNILSGKFPGLQELGIETAPLDEVLEEYLQRYRPGGFYNLAHGYEDKIGREI